MDAEKLLLEAEKVFLIRYVLWRFGDEGPGPFPKVNGKVSAKNAEASEIARERGNSVYDSCVFRFLLTSERVEEVWDLFSECIALAPNNSEELALGYGIRAGLFLQLDMYEECILDCDRAISITSSDHFKVEIMCRKAQSLGKLKRSATEVCEEAFKLLDGLQIGKRMKRNLKAILVHEVGSCDSSSEDEGPVIKKTKFSNCDDLLDFERSQEIPCASKSVTIEYNEKWGRHIVATQDIQPGEIIATVKSCLNFPSEEKKYRFCANCMQSLYLRSFIPCEKCAHSVYCNESCRKEAWEKFHQFECCFMIFYHSDILILKQYLYPLRMTLLAVYEAGGLEQIEKQLVEIENTEDVSKKGFKNGIFEECKMKTALGLEPALEEHFSMDENWLRFGISAHTVYILAKYTTFFGKKINIAGSNLFRNKDRLFTAALLLRSFYITSANLYKEANINNESEVSRYYLKTFGNFFNHSCDPNVTFCPTQHCKDIYYARYPIKKGSQLFIAYNQNTFLNKSKELRQQELKKQFSCECTACNENWSSICLPSLKVLQKLMPSMREAVLMDITKSDRKTIDPTGEFGPLILKREMILLYLRLLAKHFTVYCKEYFLYLKFLNDIYMTIDI